MRNLKSLVLPSGATFPEINENGVAPCPVAPGQVLRRSLPPALQSKLAGNLNTSSTLSGAWRNSQYGIASNGTALLP